ncbi:MAG: hypothetical protein H6834_09540 [Planctomycetes bacterium]|nr:hypothetical protein [Planctomycetota bacterium]
MTVWKRWYRIPLLWSAICLVSPGCTSLDVTPTSATEGVIESSALSFNFLLFTLPRNPRERAIELVSDADLPDTRQLRVVTYPHPIWPISWLNELIGYYGASCTAEYGLPKPPPLPGAPTSAPRSP